MTDSRALDRVDTGVPGFDTILNGGLIKGGVYVVEGAPGSGKTILANQICFHRASRGESTIYITLLAESHTRMIAHLRSMEFFRADLIASSIYYISAFKVLEEAGLDGLLGSIQQAVHQREAAFVVLDGLASAEEFAPSPRDFKKFIHEVQTITSMTGCTLMMLSSTEREAAFRPEHTMVDGMFELADHLDGVRSLRSIVVRKMRGTPQLRGKHSLEITNAGITVRPRIEALLRGPDASDEVADRDLVSQSFQIASLDAMLGGGLPGTSNTLLLGPSGSGKTLLGLQFVVAGAKVGQKGLYLGFYERPAHLRSRGARLDLGVSQAVDVGLLELQWETPIEGVIDTVVERVVRTVIEKGIKRLCFDGLHGFMHHAEFPTRTRAVVGALLAELKRLGVTSVFTLETRDLVGPRIEIPIDGVSSIAENIILLRHVELRSQLFRLISIVKMRDRAYDSRIREFQISDRGLLVADTFDSAEQILSGMARTVGPEK
ncbi:ATPase domain-containing protein [soil metagenome]